MTKKDINSASAYQTGVWRWSVSSWPATRSVPDRSPPPHGTHTPDLHPVRWPHSPVFDTAYWPVSTYWTSCPSSERRSEWLASHHCPVIGTHHTEMYLTMQGRPNAEASDWTNVHTHRYALNTTFRSLCLLTTANVINIVMLVIEAYDKDMKN